MDPARHATAVIASDFDRATQVVPDPDNDTRVLAELDAGWSSLRGLHGGYLTALAVRAAEAAVPKRAVRTVVTSFLRPATVGAAQLDIAVIRNGRSLATVVVDLAQDGRLVASTRVTLLAPTSASAHPERIWSSVVRERPAPVAACLTFTPPPSIPHFLQADLRIDPATIPISPHDAAAAPSANRARLAGHVRPIDGRALDAAWLVMIGDWFPPSPFLRLLPPIGGVSIDYAVHIHHIPDLAAGAYLEGVFEAADSRDGIALERGVLCTADGVAIVETFHTRWTG